MIHYAYYRAPENSDIRRKAFFCIKSIHGWSILSLNSIAYLNLFTKTWFLSPKRQITWKFSFRATKVEGLPLHIFHKMKHLESFFIKLHVDGGIQRLLFWNFQLFLKIWPLEDPLLTDASFFIFVNLTGYKTYGWTDK